ncbi:MAG: flagellar export protein FliJ [Candidatus Competibacter denitrificans]
MAGKAHPLQAAVDVARSREDQAVKLLAESQRNLREQETRLQQLLLFRGEYAVQFEAEGGSGGITARRFQDYAAFLNSLDHGITESKHQQERLREDLQRKRQHWVQTHARTKALQEVLARDQDAQRKREDQRAQRDSDERNLQRASARTRSADEATSE